MLNPLHRWLQLRSSDSGDGVVEVPTLDSGIDTGFGVVRYAIGLHGEPRLLVPTSGYHPAGLTSTSKLSISIVSLAVAGKSVRFIDIMCLEKTLNAVFAELTEAILRRLENGDSPHTAVASAIHDFRVLLGETSAPQTPESAILGLVGELLVLHELVRIDPGALDAWSGPLGQRHDFRRGVHALEVKTSGRLDTMQIGINGIDQLELPEDGTLVLAHVNLEKAKDGKLSVAELVKLLQACGVNASTLHERLAAIGCQSPDAPEWNRIAYSDWSIKTYQVGSGFPRITRSALESKSLPAGVSNLSYAVDLTHATAYELSESEQMCAFERISK